MKVYNITKARGESQMKDKYIESLHSETINLKVEILDLQVVNSKLNEHLERLNVQQKEDTKEKLEAQKEYLSTRHTAILTDFSEKLKLKYEQNFKRSTEHCKSETLSLKREIDRLSVELDSTRRTIRSVGTRRPVYSPGKYTDNG